MKKILVTHATGRFGGAFTLLYGDAGMGAEALPPLLDVDMRGVEMTDEQKKYLLAQVPARYGEGFEAEFGAGKLRFVFEDCEVGFDEFWEAYSKKVNKDRCVKLWDKMSRLDRVLAVTGLAAYKRYLAKTNWRTKADPEKYLMKKYWLTDWDNVSE